MWFWNVLFFDLGAGYIDKNSSSCIHDLCINFQKEITLKRKQSVQYLISTSVPIRRPFSPTAGPATGAAGPGEDGVEVASLSLTSSSACQLLFLTQGTEERTEVLTWLVLLVSFSLLGPDRFLQLFLWWSVFVVPLESPAVSLRLQLPSDGQRLSSSQLFRILPPSLPCCRPRSLCAGVPSAW